MDETLSLQSIMPRPDDISVETCIFDYHREADMLIVHFGSRRPAVVHDVNDYMNLMIDIESQEVVGLQIDAYLSRAVFQDPRLLDLARLAGIPDEEIEAISCRISPSKRAEATLRSLVSDLHLTTIT